MRNQFLSLLKRFIQDDSLSIQELRYLQAELKNPDNSEQLDAWMHEYWLRTERVEFDISFDELIAKINEEFEGRKTLWLWEKRWIKQLQQIAAILILPVLIFASYLFFQDFSSELEYVETIVPKGQKSEIILPDDTHIWLNAGTRLRYPIKYGRGTREVFLDGEAYFEVAHNSKAPFIVNTKNVAVKVLGTSFNVKAYINESHIETALLKGKISLIVENEEGQKSEYKIKPGELVNLQSGQSTISKTYFDPDEVVGWKNNRLVFRDDTFSNLVKKIERWYDVEIIYDEKLYDHQRLTVELREGERLERLMQIIEKAMSVSYSINKQKIYINPKMKN